MKRIVNILTAALALVVISAACNKVTPVTVDDTPVAKTMTIKVTIGDAATRVTFDPAFDSGSKPTGMSHTWEAGDRLRIIDASNPSVSAVFDIVDGIGTDTGVFKGEGFEAASYNVEAIPNGTFVTDGNQTQAKDGATDHLKFVATATGVTDLSSFVLTETSGFLGVIAKLPAGAAATIDKVTVDVSMYGITVPAITVALTAQEDVDTDDILKIYANVPAGFSVPSGAEAFLRFSSTNAEHTVYTRYLDLSSLGAFVDGKFNYIKLNCSHIDQYAGGSDAGTAANPYLIADKYQLLAVDGLMKAGSKTYFKLLDDLDMTGETWSLLNNPSPYDRVIDFDGNGKAISHLGGTMFYVFKGSIKNLTLDAPSVTSGSQKGAFAQYIQGTDNYVTNVDIKDVSEFAASSGNCGGLIGRINSGTEGATTATIVDCDVTNVPVNSTGKAGGLIGSVEAKVVIQNCTVVGGTISNTNHYTGGLIAYAPQEVAISKCQTNVTVKSTGKYRVGGLIGWAVKGSVTQCSAAGDVSGAQYVGGLIGTVSNAESESFSISESCFTGTVTPTGNIAGGIVASKEGAGALSITDCYASGSITGSGPQRFGGILADHFAGTSTLENCYFSGILRTNACIGGIVGWVEADGLSVVRCMPYPAELHATQEVETTDRYCSGLVIGYANKSKSPKMVVDKCYRGVEIASNFQDYTGVQSINVVENHAFINPAAAIPQRHELEYGYYHHGRKTNSATLSALVQRDDIGGAWSSAIWDFSEDYPRLKWML